MSERNVSISEFYNADEAFICGTVGEIAPVVEIDRRPIGRADEVAGSEAHAVSGPWTRRLSDAYRAYALGHGTPVD